MTSNRLKNFQEYEDGQMRGVLKEEMMPITADLWTYASLAQGIEGKENERVKYLQIHGFILQGLRELAKEKKPHYKELVGVLMDRHPIFETQRILTEEEVAGF